MANNPGGQASRLLVRLVEALQRRRDAHKDFQVGADLWRHSEQIRWTVFANFLVASTVILLAWAAVFAAPTTQPVQPTGRLIVLVALSLFGAALGVIFSRLARRAHKLQGTFDQMVFDLEQEVPERLHFLTKTRARQRGELNDPSGWSRSNVIQTEVPLMFTLLHVILLLGLGVSTIGFDWLSSSSISSGPPIVLLPIVASFILGIVVFWQSWGFRRIGKLFTIEWARALVVISILLNVLALVLWARQ